MSKKGNQKFGKVQSGGGNFNKGKGNNETDFLYREESDDTPFMSFTFEDFPNFEIDNEDDQELIFILKRICASYKYVLTLDFRSFWSTLKFNQLLRRSLNTFLQFSTKRRFNEYYRRGHERKDIETSESETKIILKEISRLVLTILYRIVSCQDENLNKSNEFACHKIILDEWLIDIPKMLDIIAIYGLKNEKIVKEIIRKSFQMQKEFQQDFDELQEKLLKDYLDGYYKELMLLKKKDKLGSASCDIADSDIERKVELLCSILDTASSIIDIVTYFPPQEVENMFLDEKINITMENIFYELIFAREEAWVMGKFRGDIILLIDVVLDKIVAFFVSFFTQMIKVFGDKNLVKQGVGKKMISMWNKYIKDLGKVASQGKKQGENRYWYLIEYSSDRIDFTKLFEVAPADNSETYQMFQIQVMSVIDERKRNIIAYEEKKEDYEQKGEDEKQQQQMTEEIPDIKFVETIVKEDIIKQEEKQRRAEEFQKKKEEEDQKLREEQEKEDEIRRLEEKAEKLTMYQKGAQKVSVKMSDEEHKKYVQKSLWLAMEYDDEPDDSQNHFQPVVSNNNNNNDGEEDAESEGEEDENGVKKPRQAVEEGYDDGQRRRNNQGYQPRPKNHNPNKTDHHQAKLKYKNPNYSRAQYNDNNQNTNSNNNNNNNNATYSNTYPNTNNNNNNNNNRQNNNRQDNNASNQQSNNNQNQYQRKNNNNFNNNNNNNSNNNNFNNNPNPQKPQFKKNVHKNEEGYSGSDDDSKPQQQQQRPQYQRNNNNNYNKEGGYKSKAEAQPQKNILKKKQYD